MVLFSCPRCSYETNRLPDYKKHVHRKTECQDVNGSLIPFSQLGDILRYEITNRKTNATYECEECGKQFASSQLKYQHKMRSHYRGHDSQQDKLVSTIVEQISGIGGPPQNVTINIYNNTITNNMIINAFGNEKYNHVFQNKKRLIHMFLNKAPGYIKLAEDIFFNKEHPENRNVRIRNKKLPYAECYDGEKWLTGDQKNVLIDMINTVKNLLDEYVTYNQKEIREYCNPSLFSAAMMFLNNLKDAIDMENLKSTQIKLLKGVIHDMKILVLNNS